MTHVSYLLLRSTWLLCWTLYYVC